MKFLVLASALAAVAQAAIEPNTAFGLITLRSASPVHLLFPSVDTDGRLVVNGSKDYFSGTFLPDGRVRTGGTDQWLSVGTDGALRVATAKPTVFGVADDYPTLTLNGSWEFTAVPEGTKYVLYAGKKSDAGDYLISLRVNWVDELNRTSSSTANTTASATATSTIVTSVSSSHEATATATATTTVHQVNGASSYSVAGAAALLAGAGALLL